jgi:hypothetical protein
MAAERSFCRVAEVLTGFVRFMLIYLNQTFDLCKLWQKATAEAFERISTWLTQPVLKL